MAEYLGKLKQDREKYLNLNDDDILSGLTADELHQLNLDFEEIDPDVSTQLNTFGNFVYNWSKV